MAARLSLWGVGPRTITLSALYGLLTLVVTRQWPQYFALDFIPYTYLAIAAAVLAVPTAVLYAVTLRAISRAYKADRLVTTGVYAVCRNPLYAIWVFLWLPIIALAGNSWLFATSSVVLYVLIRWFIGREEKYLEERFGQEYLDYERRVNAVMPTWPRR